MSKTSASVCTRRKARRLPSADQPKLPICCEVSSVGFDIALDHVALSVSHIDQSVAWYQKMFGFKEIRHTVGPNGMRTALIQRGDVRIELFQVPGAAPLPESRRNPSEDFRTHRVKHFAFRVKDIRAALAQLQAKGVKVAFELHDYPGAAFAFVSDNAGKRRRN